MPTSSLDYAVLMKVAVNPIRTSLQNYLVTNSLTWMPPELTRPNSEGVYQFYVESDEFTDYHLVTLSPMYKRTNTSEKWQFNLVRSALF